MASEVEIKGVEAERLRDDPVFVEILGEIEAAAIVVFRNPHASIEEISAAHTKVRAVDVIRNAIKARIDSATFAKRKKDQHRGND